MPPIETKEQLLARLRESRAALEKAVEKAGTEAMTRPGICGDWSGKDILAHLTDWQKMHLVWWAAIQRGEQPEVPAPGLTWKPADVDRINQQIYQSHCAEPLEVVVQNLRETFTQFLAAVEATPEEDLFRPGVASFTGKNTLERWYREYAQHDGWGRSKIYNALVRKKRQQ